MRTKAEAMKDVGKVLRHRVVIQRKTVEADEIGNSVETWRDWRTVWAERSNLWGREYYAAKMVGEEETVVFMIRRAAFVREIDTVNHRLVHLGSAYDIKQIDLVDDAWVKVKAMERGASG